MIIIDGGSGGRLYDGGGEGVAVLGIRGGFDWEVSLWAVVSGSSCRVVLVCESIVSRDVCVDDWISITEDGSGGDVIASRIKGGRSVLSPVFDRVTKVN